MSWYKPFQPWYPDLFPSPAHWRLQKVYLHWQIPCTTCSLCFAWLCTVIIALWHFASAAIRSTSRIFVSISRSVFSSAASSIFWHAENVVTENNLVSFLWLVLWRKIHFDQSIASLLDLDDRLLDLCSSFASLDSTAESKAVLNVLFSMWLKFFWLLYLA